MLKKKKKTVTFFFLAASTVGSCSREPRIAHTVGRRPRSVLLKAIRHSSFFLPSWTSCLQMVILQSPKHLSLIVMSCLAWR